ncbi:MAG: DUF4282 domain-containing protein [Candidatus Thermoplasmatota archaeon]|nr:DUF4282 domain-containing protein [Candidatus Thermoplasmatota archaeon]
MVNKRGPRAYFSFRWLITPGIIRVIHVIGLIIINLILFAGFIGGIIFTVMGAGEMEIEGGYIALGILVIIIAGIVTFLLTNLAWRVMCEQGILFFSIHEINASMENELKGINQKMKVLVDKTMEKKEEDEDEEDEDEEDED